VTNSRADGKPTGLAKQNRKQNIIEGGLILSLALLVIKILGWAFRIVLLGIYTAKGNGYFITVYAIYTLIYSLVVQGAPVAISRLVSQYSTQGRYRDIRNLEKISLKLFTAVGLAGALVLAAFAVPYARTLTSDYRYYIFGIWAICPAVFFCSLMSVYRGYNQGMKNMIPTATSQVVEVVVKVVAGVALAWAAKAYFTNQLQTTGKVLGIALEQNSEEFILALSAAGALLGVTVSNVAGWAFLALRRWRYGDGIRKVQINESPAPLDAKVILKAIVWTVLPIALSASAASLMGVIDSNLLVWILDRLYDQHREVFLASHNHIFDAEFADPKFSPSNYLYGIYGSILTVMNLVPTITGSFGMSALPQISSSWTAGNRSETKKNIETAVRICMLICAPAGFGLAMLSGPILNLVYHGSPETVAIGGRILFFLGFVAIVTSLMAIVTAMFQAIGKMKIPLILTLISLVIKVIVNVAAVSIPRYNIILAPLGNLAGFTFICVAGFIIFTAITKIRISIFGPIVKPLIAGAATGLTAKYAYALLSRFFGEGIVNTAVSIMLAACVYLACVLALKILDRDDVLSLPGGRKLAAIMDRAHLLRTK